MRPAIGHIIRPAIDDGCDTLGRPYRVLAIDEESDSIWLIAIPGRKSRYVEGPERFSLEDIKNDVAAGALVSATVPLPGLWQLSDADYVNEAPTDREKELRQKRIEERDRRWKVVEAIVGGHTAQSLAPIATMLREEVKSQATAHKRSVPTIYSWLHRYWAGGECINSLIPNWSKCGGSGLRKVQTGQRLGRKSRAFIRGAVESEGYILKEGDPERLALGYSLVKPRVTVRDAYLRTSAAFWSDTRQNDQGEIECVLREPHVRPTQVQFEYWGGKIHGSPLRRRMLGVDGWNTSTLAVAGSAQDQVHAVGQMAMIDSTSTDVYLTSVYSRSKVLPPMHRTIVKDVRSTLLIGFYVGWEAPSYETCMQAILCSADSKVELYAKFGIAIDEDVFPGMLHRLYLADQGEMKSAAMLEAEKNFRFGIEFAKSYSGQSKSQVETQHHTDHKELDHKLSGTTHGKQRQRGEKAPALEALWNYPEYMREFLLWVLQYNNQEVSDLAPTDMLIAGVRPTRLNIFKWLRDHNACASLPCDVNHLRTYALPETPAVMRRDGIHLLMEDGIRFLPGNRFHIGNLEQDHRWQRAVANQTSVKISVKFDGKDLSQVWLPTSDGLLRIPNVVADIHTQNEISLVDFVQHVTEEDVRADLERGEVDQRQLNTTLRRDAVEHQARKEKLAEQKLQPKKVSKKQQISELRKNRDEELERIRTTDNKRLPAPAASSEPTSAPMSAADLAMEKFLEEATT